MQRLPGRRFRNVYAHTQGEKPMAPAASAQDAAPAGETRDVKPAPVMAPGYDWRAFFLSPAGQS